MVVHGRDSNWRAFIQMPRLARPFEVKLVAELGKVRSHIAGILDRCNRSEEQSEKKSCQLHFFKYRCILVENEKKNLTA